MEIDAIAESLDHRFLLFGEVKWEEKSDIKTTISKLKKSIANFPKQTDKETIIAVYRCKDDRHENGEA